MMEFERQGYADQLNIETPEQVDLRFPVAGIGSRFLAVLIDHLIQFLVYLLVFVLIAIWGRAVGPTTPSKNPAHLDAAAKWFIAAIILINFCLVWGYFALFEAFKQGQTPGKRLMKLRVIKDTGRQITLFEALARNLLRIVDYFPAMYFVGVITMLCNKKNKRLGDLAAGTMVVHELRVDVLGSTVFAAEENFFARKAVIPESAFAADAVAKLQPADLHVIETFFARALDLDLATRTVMAQRIAARLAAKMGAPLPEGNPERALEAMARAMRGSARKF